MEYTAIRKSLCTPSNIERICKYALSSKKRFKGCFSKKGIKKALNFAAYMQHNGIFFTLPLFVVDICYNKIE